MQEKIIPKSDKKIRPQDTKRRRIFGALLKEFYEEYERKKKEEDDYKAKVKAAKKRPHFPDTGRTCSFKRFQPKE